MQRLHTCHYLFTSYDLALHDQRPAAAPPRVPSLGPAGCTISLGTWITGRLTARPKRRSLNLRLVFLATRVLCSGAGGGADGRAGIAVRKVSYIILTICRDMNSIRELIKMSLLKMRNLFLALLAALLSSNSLKAEVFNNQQDLIGIFENWSVYVGESSINKDLNCSLWSIDKEGKGYSSLFIYTGGTITILFKRDSGEALLNYVAATNDGKFHPVENGIVQIDGYKISAFVDSLINGGQYMYLKKSAASQPEAEFSLNGFPEAFIKFSECSKLISENI